MLLKKVSALALAMLFIAPAVAGPVAVLVAVPVPASVPRAQLEQAFAASVGDYKGKPGLIRKYYTIGDDGRAGGIYLWESRAAAEAWYGEAWHAQVLKRWGSPASVSYFDVPIVVDNGK